MDEAKLGTISSFDFFLKNREFIIFCELFNRKMIKKDDSKPGENMSVISG